MRSTLLFFVLSLFIGIQSFGQQRSSLKIRIDELADRILSSIDKDDLFIKSDKGIISDADHQFIKKIIMTNGFPTISMVGKESSHKFWMLVQFCDQDPRMQMAVSKHMGFIMRRGDIIKEDFAMLSDRARMNMSLPQLYGTQFVISDEDAILLYRTHDFGNINARRKAIGLSPYEEYKNRVAPSISSKQPVVEISDYNE